MADGSLDTEDVVVEERRKRRVFVFREYEFLELPASLVCDDDSRLLQAQQCSLGTIITIVAERIDALNDYCRRICA